MVYTEPARRVYKIVITDNSDPGSVVTISNLLGQMDQVEVLTLNSDDNYIFGSIDHDGSEYHRIEVYGKKDNNMCYKNKKVKCVQIYLEEEVEEVEEVVAFPTIEITLKDNGPYDRLKIKHTMVIPSIGRNSR